MRLYKNLGNVLISLSSHFHDRFGLHFGNFNHSLTLPLSKCLLHFLIKSLSFLFEASNLLFESFILLFYLCDLVVEDEFLLGLFCLQFLELFLCLDQILICGLLFLVVVFRIIRVLLSLFFFIEVAELTFGLY